MSIIVLLFHLFSLKAEAIELNKSNTSEFLNAVSVLEYSSGSNRQYSGFGFDGANFKGSKIINSFTITDLDEPRQASLLDTRATIIADNGVYWEIPVIWVDEEGNEISIHLDIRKSYPVFVFFLPEGYSIKNNDDGAFNIFLPDFVNEILNTNGMLSLADTSNGLIYFTARLGGYETLNENAIQPSILDYSSNEEQIAWESQTYENYGQEINVYEDKSSSYQNDLDNFVIDWESDDIDSVPSSSPNGNDDPINETDQNGVDPTPQSITDGNDTEPNSTEPIPQSITDGNGTDQNSTNTTQPPVETDIVLMHCDSNAINTIGYDELEWLVKLVKYNVEPQAVNLLLDSFPAYQAAADNNELGKNIGLYIYYNDYTDSRGEISNRSDVIGGVAGQNSGDTYEYRIVLNASKIFDYDASTDSYSHDDGQARETIDNAVIHELMHSFMYDYTRTGMTGEQYSSTSGEALVHSEASETYSEVKYPTWFIEGIASTVDNTIQANNDILQNSYGYDDSKDSYDVSKIAYSFAVDKTIQLSYCDDNQVDSSDTVKSAYISGYLANVYLGYLAAKKYDGVDAISGNTNSGDYSFDSSIIRGGVNHILEELHEGKTLDEVIKEISTDNLNYTQYKDTEDFTKKFGKNGAQDFIADFLNYIESISSDDAIANGSILMEFTDTTQSPLQTDNNESATVYVPADTKDFVTSTVSNEDALQAGGCSELGITEDTEADLGNNSNDENNSGGNNSNDEINSGGNNSNDEIHSGYNSNDEFNTVGGGGFGGFDEFHTLKIDSSSLNGEDKEQPVCGSSNEIDEDGFFDIITQESNSTESLEDESYEPFSSSDSDEVLETNDSATDTSFETLDQSEDETIEDMVKALASVEYSSNPDANENSDDSSDAENKEDALVNVNDDGTGKENDGEENADGEPSCDSD